MLETSRNINQWFAQASKLCGGKWYYRGETGARAHQLMTRLCTVDINHSDHASLLWHNEPITKRGLQTLWKEAPAGAIIAGEGYGVLADNSVSRTVKGFAESEGIVHHHNRSEPAVWWIVKEQANESTLSRTDETLDDAPKTDAPVGSVSPGSE